MTHTGQECCEAAPCPVVALARNQWRRELKCFDENYFYGSDRVRFLEKAEQNAPDAMTVYTLARIYWKNEGPSAQALVMFRRAISLLTASHDDTKLREGWRSGLAHWLLCSAYHCKYAASPVERRQVRALEAEAAEILLQLPQPDSSDLYELGVCWLLGRGVAQNHMRGVAALERAVACAWPIPSKHLAAYRLGCLYLSGGAALPIDKPRAWSLFLSTTEKPRASPPPAGLPDYLQMAWSLCFSTTEEEQEDPGEGSGDLDLVGYLHKLCPPGKWDNAYDWLYFGLGPDQPRKFLAVALFELGRLCVAPWRHKLRGGGGVPPDEGPWSSLEGRDIVLLFSLAATPDEAELIYHDNNSFSSNQCDPLTRAHTAAKDNKVLQDRSKWHDLQMRQLICAGPSCELCGWAALPGGNCDKAALLARAEQEHSSASRARTKRSAQERSASAWQPPAMRRGVHKLRWLRLSARGEKHGLRWQVLWQLGLDLWKSQAPRAATQAERALLELEAMECFEQAIFHQKSKSSEQSDTVAASMRSRRRGAKRQRLSPRVCTLFTLPDSLWPLSFCLQENTHRVPQTVLGNQDCGSRCSLCC
eukprot:g27931.t1